MDLQVRRISQLVLKREHVFVDTVGLGCVETPTQVNITKIILLEASFLQAFFFPFLFGKLETSSVCFCNKNGEKRLKVSFFPYVGQSVLSYSTT